MRKVSRVVRRAAVTAFAGVLCLAGAAMAQTVTVPDAGDDMGYPADIQSVRVAHTADHVRVIVNHRDLIDDGLTGARVYFDTDAKRPGPEYVLLGGLYKGTDYGLFRARSNWRPKGTPVSDCDYALRLRFATERTLVNIDPSCFGDPEEVRVGVFVSTDGRRGTKTDWLSGERALTDWVARG
jgi:hypothetical protein